MLAIPVAGGVLTWGRALAFAPVFAILPPGQPSGLNIAPVLLTPPAF